MGATACFLLQSKSNRIALSSISVKAGLKAVSMLIRLKQYFVLIAVMLKMLTCTATLRQKAEVRLPSQIMMDIPL